MSGSIDSSDTKNSATYSALKDCKFYSTLFKHKLEHGNISVTQINRDNKISEVYVWGSNSSYQLGETGLDRMMLPKLAPSFSDIDCVRLLALAII